MPIQKKIQSRNGEIDILRFLFSIIIVFLHFSSSFSFDFCRNGGIGVEFFFLTSGYYMAKHARKIVKEKQDITNQTWKYIINKTRSFYRYYIVGIILNIIIRYVLIQHKSINQIFNLFLKSIPTFGLFFLGTNSNSIGLYVPNTWFLSAMMIACFILYPIILWRHDLSTKILFPVVSIFLLGYMYVEKGTLFLTHDHWSGLINLGILRSIAEMALGASLLPLSEYIREKWPNNTGGGVFGSALVYNGH